MTTAIDRLIEKFDHRPQNTAKAAPSSNFGARMAAARAKHKADPPKKGKAPIHIKKANKGKLHEKLGVPKDEKIPQAKIEAAEKSSSPALRKEAVFAENAKGWSHGGHQTHIHIHLPADNEAKE